MTKALEFSFQGQPVGCFEESEYPQTSGRYRYAPQRGIGHYEMGKALGRGPVQCSFKDDGLTRKFTVLSEPEPGVLEVEFG